MNLHLFTPVYANLLLGLSSKTILPNYKNEEDQIQRSYAPPETDFSDLKQLIEI